jgi:hypothetical protein
MSVAKVRCQLPKPNRVGPITIGHGNPCSGDPVHLSEEKLPLAGRCDLSSGLSLTILADRRGFAHDTRERGIIEHLSDGHHRFLGLARATNIPVRPCDTYPGMPPLYARRPALHAGASNVGSPDGSFQTDGTPEPPHGDRNRLRRSAEPCRALFKIVCNNSEPYSTSP